MSQIAYSPCVVIQLVAGRGEPRVEATLWLDGCPAEGHSDSTGTLTVRELADPLIRRLERERDHR